MRILEPDYYRQFHCTADRCPDTCCSAWEVIIDDKTLDFYRRLPGRFGESVRRSLCHTDGAWMFRTKNGSCPLLTKEGLCALQQRYGHESLCTTCQEYPRFVSEHGLFQERGLSLSCPEVCRMLLQQTEPVTFLAYENAQPLTGCHEIDGERFLHLKTARNKAMTLAQSRDVPVAERIGGLLQYAEQLQQCIAQDDLDGMDALCPHGLPLSHLRPNCALRTYRKWLHTLTTMEVLSPKWRDTLQMLSAQAEAIDPQVWAQERRQYRAAADPIQAEQILVYYVYKFFLRSAYLGDVLTQMKLIAFCTIMIDALDFSLWRTDGVLVPEKQTELTHRFARELEHSDRNWAALTRRANFTGAFSTQRILELLGH